MTLQEIQIGTRLELELLNKYNDRVGNTYVSQLLEQQESSLMVISAPIFEARLVFIPLQSHLKLTFVHHKYGLLGFAAFVMGCEFKGNIAVLIVQPEGELVKIQRRTHYRLEYIADILIRLCGMDLNTDKKAFIKAYTKNISGSGICVISTVDIPKNSEVKIELNLTEDIKIIAKCIVLRNTRFDILTAKSYELGLHFTDISQKDQESLIKYIFEQQRVRLKNGL